jgi:hypothetical protein
MRPVPLLLLVGIAGGTMIGLRIKDKEVAYKETVAPRLANNDDTFQHR